MRIGISKFRTYEKEQFVSENKTMFLLATSLQVNNSDSRNTANTKQKPTVHTHLVSENKTMFLLATCLRVNNSDSQNNANTKQKPIVHTHLVSENKTMFLLATCLRVNNSDSRNTANTKQKPIAHTHLVACYSRNHSYWKHYYNVCLKSHEMYFFAAPILVAACSNWLCEVGGPLSS